MKVKLSDAEKTVLANYLAEKRTQQDLDQIEHLLDTEQVSDGTKTQVHEYHFNYYKNILNETDDY